MFYPHYRYPSNDDLAFCYQHPHFQWNRQYPPVDTQILSQSVIAFRKLMRDGGLLLNKLSEHRFAYQLMSAAQAGNRQEVDRLIKSIGIGSIIKTTYTPSGVMFTIDPNVPGTACCTLTMYLKWGR
jgi:hypothetical protein